MFSVRLPFVSKRSKYASTFVMLLVPDPTAKDKSIDVNTQSVGATNGKQRVSAVDAPVVALTPTSMYSPAGKVARFEKK